MDFGSTSRGSSSICSACWGCSCPSCFSACCCCCCCCPNICWRDVCRCCWLKTKSSLQRTLSSLSMKSWSPVVSSRPQTMHVKHLTWNTLSRVFRTKSPGEIPSSHPLHLVPKHLKYQNSVVHIRSFVHSLVPSFRHSYEVIRSLVKWFIRSLVKWFIRLLVKWFIRSLVKWFIRSLVKWFIRFTR